jgi:peptidoglycan hydrolase-like protein with peptidoglycan-binding domain
MTPSADGESATVTVGLVRGSAVEIEIEYVETRGVLVLDLEGNVIASASGTVPLSGNTLIFEEDQFDLMCGTFIIPTPEDDFDADGIPNGEDTDADGDGILDTDDQFVDLDSDGVDDNSGNTELETQDEGIPDTVDQCGEEPGSDGVSANAQWNDNCWVRMSNTTGEGQFANSLYTVGIQRIVYCSGFGEADSYEDFADGNFGPLTEAAVRDYQSSLSITADGEVGRSTWGALQGSLELLSLSELDTDGNALNAYGVDGDRCEDIPLFYQTIRAIPDTDLVEERGWLLAKNRPNTSETAPFTTSAVVSAVD